MVTTDSCDVDMADQKDSRSHWSTEVSAVFQTHAPRLERFLLGRLRSKQDARDAVQEIFLRFTRVPDRELVVDPVKYLFGIAHHVISEILDRRKRELVEFNSDLTDHHAEHPIGHPTDTLGNRVENQQALAVALERLRPIQREILVLIKTEGLTHEEVAATLGLSKHTVKKYVVEAMAQLRTDWLSLRSGDKKL